METAWKLVTNEKNGMKIINPIALLEQSAIIEKYNHLENLTDLGKIFALIGLAEIPVVIELDLTRKLVAFIDENIATEAGFSYTRKVVDIVPCYNGMLLEAYCKLGLGQTEPAQNALNWLKKYQLFERNQTTAWQGTGICKHGGCLKKTPCYIGIGKSMRALLAYQKYVDQTDEVVNHLLEKGTQYMKQHHFFKRLSNGRPISAHITESMFPQSYALSLTDLVYIADELNLHDEPAVADLVQLLEEKRTKNGGWKLDYIYKYNGYVAFDTRRQDSPWVSDLYQRFLTRVRECNSWGK